MGEMGVERNRKGGGIKGRKMRGFDGCTFPSVVVCVYVSGGGDEAVETQAWKMTSGER